MVGQTATHRDQRRTLLDGVQRARFAEFFPRLFAYAQSATGDHERSKEIVIEAFSRVFAGGSQFANRDFPVVLFATTMDLCREHASPGRETDGLSDPERDVISLLFDGQLTRSELSMVMKMPEESVASALVTGLRKLKGTVLEGPSPLIE